MLGFIARFSLSLLPLAVLPLFVFSFSIMDCPVTKIYLLTNGSKKLVESGTMQVLMVDPDGVKGNEDDVYILLAGGFKLALRMYVPCLEMAPRNFVFPTDDKTYGIILAESVEGASERTRGHSELAPQG